MVPIWESHPLSLTATVRSFSFSSWWGEHLPGHWWHRRDASWGRWEPGRHSSGPAPRGRISSWEWQNSASDRRARSPSLTLYLDRHSRLRNWGWQLGMVTKQHRPLLLGAVIKVRVSKGYLADKHCICVIIQPHLKHFLTTVAVVVETTTKAIRCTWHVRAFKYDTYSDTRTSLSLFQVDKFDHRVWCWTSECERPQEHVQQLSGFSGTGFLTDLYLTLTFLNGRRGHRTCWLVLFAGPTTIFGLLGVIYFRLQPFFFFFLFNLIGGKQNKE